MEFETCVGAETDNIAGVGGYLRLKKNNIGHGFTVHQKRNFRLIGGTFTRPVLSTLSGVNIGFVPDLTACKISA